MAHIKIGIFGMAAGLSASLMLSYQNIIEKFSAHR